MTSSSIGCLLLTDKIWCQNRYTLFCNMLHKPLILTAACCSMLILASCSRKTTPSATKTHTTPSSGGKVIKESGKASYYGNEFDGRKTANGEIFRQSKLTAAHRTLPFGTMVTVKNLNNGRTVTVRINDRGPFAKG